MYYSKSVWDRAFIAALSGSASVNLDPATTYRDAAIAKALVKRAAAIADAAQTHHNNMD